MSEGEVVEQLVNFTNVLLTGVSVLFSVVSAYVVALNYFIGSANLPARLGSFLFITLILALLLFVMLGAASTQAGLIDRLRELQSADALSAAGRAALVNAERGLGAHGFAARYSIDEIVRLSLLTGLALTYIALFYLTFLHRWRPDVIPVSIQDRTA